MHLGYPFERLKSICLLFAIHLLSIRDWGDAVRTDWVICSEKFLVIQTAAVIHSKKISICLNGWGHLFE